MLSIPLLVERTILSPLDRVVLKGAKGGTVVMKDGAGREYARAKSAPSIRFTVGGALGTHVVSLLDAKGRERETLRFRVDCSTSISDARGEFGRLLTLLHYTMIHWNETSNQLIDGRIYKYFVGWLRDHVHALKGMKYFYADLKDGIELYRDTQRKDGMIWDNIYPRHKGPNYWDQIFTPGGFIRQLPPGSLEMKRIPVENDVEYLFLEGIYYTWKATGDDAWMASTLDAAVKAVRYSFSDAFRWSKSHRLLKRGYTIDTWDYQPKEDADRTGHIMVVDPVKSRFGIFHGDNTGMRAGLRYLAEMLDRAGRTKEAATFRARSDELQQRLDEVSWNGSFYRHHVAEGQGIVRDLGVDQEAQLSMSNAYALNRGLNQEQCEAIIGEYQRIKGALPTGSAGEWYSIFPWYGKGFGDGQGEYMNGGVNVITAGELSHGAFEHGFESYGVDILRRIKALAEKHDGYLDCCYRGKIDRPEGRTFAQLAIADAANVDFSGTGAEGVPGWTSEGVNDLHEMPVGDQVFLDIPFRIPDPAKNKRRGCIGISSRPGYRARVEIPVGRAAASLYLLHTLSGGSGLAGTLTIAYADGTSHSHYVRRGSDVVAWWMPEHPKSTSGIPNLKVAWEGANATCKRVGVAAWGFDNPHPDKPIDRLVFEAAQDGAWWMVCGLTLGDQPAWFEPSDVSYGIPDNWGAAAVVYALVEGLAGVVDKGTAFDRVALAPRWSAAGVDAVTAHVTYPASKGYLSYAYAHDKAAKRIALTVTGGGEVASCSILLPAKAKRVKAVKVDGAVAKHREGVVRGSRYAEFDLDLRAVRQVVVAYS